MRLTHRLRRLEGSWAEHVAVTGSRFPATCDGALAWTKQFAEADPRHAAILKDIEAYGRRHPVDHFYAGRTEPWHAGEHANAVFLTVLRPINNRHAGIGPEYLPAIPLARRLAPLLAEYFQDDRNAFLLDDWFIACFRRTQGRRFAAGLLLIFDAAEEWARSGNDERIQAWRSQMAAIR